MLYLPATVLKGGTKDQPTNATLSIIPRREDDGAKYKCVVRNRAMNEGKRLEATATLNVNCKCSDFNNNILSIHGIIRENPL